MRIDPAIGVFAAAADPSNGAALSPFLSGDGGLILFEEAAPPVPAAGVAVEPMVQMVADAIDPPGPGAPIEVLGDADATEMLALATLTRPGPFLARTHSLGGFVGVRAGGALVAMAGTRLRVPGHVEVSAVCTHPDHRGKGHGARLIRAVGAAILARGDRPFLHSFARNEAAIALYERLGFRTRQALLAVMLPPTPR